MSNWRIPPQVIVLVAGFGLGALLFSPLSGCRGELPEPFRIAAEIIANSDLDLPAESRAELQRFNAMYTRYSSDPGSRQLKHFADSFKRVRVRFVYEVEDAALIDAALKGIEDLDIKPGSAKPAVIVEAALDAMMVSLDPHSSYLNPSELKETNAATRGKFGGLGIEVTMENGLVKVVSPIEDTPAYKAGLMSGDLITHTDGNPILGKSLMEAVRVMRGAPGSIIRLTIKRGNQPPFDVSIKRAIINVRSVRWRIEDDVGYVRITSFTEQVEPGIIDAIKQMRARRSDLIGLVLDLRNNPGGLLDQSVALSDAFLEQGLIVSVKGRVSYGSRIFDAAQGDLLDGLPMVVLINRGSASASEIVASALKDQHRATIMGTRSFGKGSVQTITPLPLEGALRLTTQLYYGPSGRAIQANGVEPDIRIVKTDAEEGDREEDLPGVLPAVSGVGEGARASIDEAKCPVAGEKDKPDPVLGCAIAYLKAGSAKKFLAGIGADGAI